MAVDNLTVARLRELLHYDPETGLFTKRVPSGKWKAGQQIGHVAPDGYVHIFLESKRRKAHRLAWAYVHGEWPRGPIDHINGLKADNRLSNLRDATVFINAQNLRAPYSGNRTGLLGVSRQRSGRFSSTIVATLAGHKLQLYLGTYDDESTAHAVYLEAKRLLHPGCTI